MATDRAEGGGRVGGEGSAEQLRHPRLTRGWLRTASAAHRAAFEHEMERSRRAFSAEFDRFWRSHREQQT